MNQSKIIQLNSILAFIVIVAGLACTNSDNKQATALTNSDETKNELRSIDSLLRDSSFALDMAKSLDSAYYIGVGQTPPVFLSPAEESTFVSIPLKQEKNSNQFGRLLCTGVWSWFALRTDIANTCCMAGKNSRGAIDSIRPSCLTVLPMPPGRQVSPFGP